MHDLGKALVVANLLIVHSSTGAVEVEGRTINQMPFSGVLESANYGFIDMSNQAEEGTQISIPIDQVERLSTVVTVLSASGIADLLQHPAVLHLWSENIQERLVQYLENLMDEGQWSNSYHLSCKLEKAFSNPDLRDRIHLSKAWALFEMGLFKQSISVIEERETAGTPLRTTTRYCWLRTKLALMEGNFELATYWSLLPVLRIPSDTSDLALQLYQECEIWNEES